MYTGHETLTITVLPGDKNYKYVLSTDVTEWQWDTHLLKWAKRRDMPTNGTRTFIIKHWLLSGPFEVPTITTALGVHFVCGNSVDGVIPDSSSLSWKVYDYSQNTPQNGLSFQSVGDSIRINIVKYLEDVKKMDLSGNNGLGRFAMDKFGACIGLSFPYVKGQYENNILDVVASKEQDPLVSKCLKKYSFISLPDLYCDEYVDPYAPVTEFLPNGHKLVTTLQPNQSVHTLETWEENDYLYTKKYEGHEEPTIGKKTVDGKQFIHVISTDRYDYYEEKGFFDKGKYYLTYINRKELNNPTNYKIDWTPYESEGYYIIFDSESSKYAVAQEDSVRPSYLSLIISSSYLNKDFEHNIFKEVSKDSLTTVSVYNNASLSPQAKEFINLHRIPLYGKSSNRGTKFQRLQWIQTEMSYLPNPKENYGNPQITTIFLLTIITGRQKCSH